ncbi:MAG: DUF4876 domain-containing protein [Proteobacteria bacterium]|nr:DUF4876 domain-containing protein [Pseudomonadota bacterium]
MRAFHGVLALVLAIAGCTPEPEPVPLDPVSPRGRLVVEEFYYAGAAETVGADHYFSDQFVELRNDSAEPVMIGGLVLGDASGAAGEINPGMVPDGYADDPDHVYLENVWRIPGAPEDVILEPGGSVVIAHDGTNHIPFSTVDLSGADWEAFVEVSGADEDHPTVDNLESIHFTGGVDWLMTVFGPTIVVLELDSENDLEPFDGAWGEIRRAPVEAVVDAVEALMDGDSGDFKRLPDSVDAGFVHVSDIYTGESVRRRRDGDSLQDTDDSGADFEVRSSPEPFE